MTEDQDDQEPLLTGVGPAWFPPPEPPGPAPNWLNGRAFPAVWRDTLPFTVGSLMAAQKEFPHMLPGAGWRLDPEPRSVADVDQAIAAKIHLGLRTLPILAEAQLVVVEPADVRAIPEWDDIDQATEYAGEAELPASPMFLDFEAIAGVPVSWEAESWPLPFDLRGALCWVRDDILSVVPYGSVGGVHPWGGTDYQAWTRWLFLRGETPARPSPGPGDFMARADGAVSSWVDLEAESICSHHGRIGWNLTTRVLRLLWALEWLEVRLVPPSLPRPERRRAQRAGQAIGLVPDGLPRWTSGPGIEPADDGEWSAMAAPCPLPNTHARLNQAHALWHQSLEAYHDPEAFVTQLNALIQTLRNVTWALQKELGSHPELVEGWYAGWRARMSTDLRMKWIVAARNRIVKQGDLTTHSKARVRIVGELISGGATDLDVDPAATAHDIVRTINLLDIDERVRQEGTLVVERRWTVEEFAEEELLDVLADCYAVLSVIVAEGHEQLKTSMETCEKTAEPPCGTGGPTPHPAGRLPCMWTGREARTSRRNLASGAPTGVTIHTIARPPLDLDTIRERYSTASWEQPAPDADLFEQARVLHQHARRMLLVDGEHVTITWLLRDGERLSQQTLWPQDQRDKYLMVERLASEATRLGANELILTAEAWEAPYVTPEDARGQLRAAERDDRSEVLLTHALRRDGPCQTWRSAMIRSDDGLSLGEPALVENFVPPIFQPLIDAWAEWTPPP